MRQSIVLALFVLASVSAFHCAVPVPRTSTSSAARNTHAIRAGAPPASPTIVASAKAAVTGAVSFVAASRPAQGAIAAVGLFWVITELRKRSKLIETSEACELGNEAACDDYDQQVDSTAAWKLKRVLKKIMLTNVLQAKLDGAPPSGYTWGKTL